MLSFHDPRVLYMNTAIKQLSLISSNVSR
jgi:hypothetical protein